MKRFLCGLLMLLVLSASALAGYVGGHYRSNGTYVQPYYRSDSNYTVKDNYSYKGNYNPYTGETGQNYYRQSPTSDYYRGW